MGDGGKGLKEIRADLHIHVGRTSSGVTVKIPSSPELTVEGILRGAPHQGLDLVGIVDAHVPAVQDDLAALLAEGQLVPLTGGGYRFVNGVVLLAGMEMESARGRLHQVAFFPSLTEVADLAQFLRQFGSGRWSSPQHVDAGPLFLLKETLARQGFFFFAHIFTPHRGLYAAGTLDDFLPEGARREVAAMELGLSADTEMADRLAELAPYTFLSNSDAHSPERLGREFNVLWVEDADFGEVEKALFRQDGRRVVANYGLDPRLGKYHRTYCPSCRELAGEDPPVLTCPVCGNERVVLGVLDRIAHLAQGRTTQHPLHRPPYFRQIPFEHLPGFGPRTREVLRRAFGNEVWAYHEAPPALLATLLGQEKTELLLAARRGELALRPGGGGRYGRVLRK
jgi:uncharacterized protein (TIGR00375 family)